MSLVDLLHELGAGLLGALARASLEAALLAGLAGALVRWVPALPARARAWIWWLVCLKVLLSAAGLQGLPLSVLPAGAGGRATAVAALPVAGLVAPPSAGGELVPSDPVAEDSHVAGLSWKEALVLLWLGGVFVGLGQSVAEHRRLWLCRRVALPVRDPRWRRLGHDLSRRLGLRRPPALRWTDAERSPQVAGLFRPTVLLPAGRLPDPPAAEPAMVLCHELAHLAHSDLWLAGVVELAQRLFFFHPLVRLAVREHLLAREMACDARVLTVLGTAPRDYGTLLLRWGLARRETGLAAAAARPTAQTLKRRLEMLGSTVTQSSHRWWWAPALLVALLPVSLAARPEAPPTRSASRTAAAAGHHDGPSWILFKDAESASMHGSFAELERVKKLRQGTQPLLWFQDGGHEYVVRDAAILDEAMAIWKPVGELGEQMGELGGRQGDLGGQQGELGGRQGEIGARQGKLGAEQGKIGSRLQELASEQMRLERDGGEHRDSARSAAIDDEMERLTGRMDELGEQMEELGRQMEELGRQQEPLGRQQEELGRQQEALGRQMETLSTRAEAAMSELFARAKASGKAELLP